MRSERRRWGWQLLSLLILSASLVGCTDSGFNDLDAFMAEKRASPGGAMEPIPSFRADNPFTYAVTTLRSPFERPVDIRQPAVLSGRAALRPDASRSREYLERFSLDSLLMVGSLARGGQDWALIKDPEGGIHRVQVGHFLGRDHGRIAEMGATYVAVIEIVPDGTGEGWVERPTTMKLTGL